MSTSPERCLGALIKDIDQEINPDSPDLESKDTCQMSSEQKLSLDSINSFNSLSTIFPQSNDSKISLYTSNNQYLFLFSKNIILSSFNSQPESLYLQKMLMITNQENYDIIISELKGCFSQIIKDKNGNYFCSDLFKLCNYKQRLKILEEISLTLNIDCLDEYGTHPIQTIIEISSNEDEYKLILSSFNEELSILTAAKNQNGFYVIQKIINHIPENIRMNFNNLFLKLFYTLSLDIYGISTVKAFIKNMENDDIMNQVWNITYNHFLEIARNQYGNYLIQAMLEHWGNNKSGIKLKKICINYFNILMENHYSKYICDLFLNKSNIEEKKFVLATLLRNKHNLNLFDNNNKRNNINVNKNINNNENNNENVIGIGNILFPLSNDAKPFIPKKYNLKNEKEKNKKK